LEIVSFRKSIRIVYTDFKNIFDSSRHRLGLRANGPELSCGDEKPPQGSSLRGRSSQMR
jgi:hypothetical protein